MTGGRRVTVPADVDPVELARALALVRGLPTSAPVMSPDALHAVVYPMLAGRDREAFVIVAFDRRMRVTGTTVDTVGSDAFCIVEPRQILRWALTQGRSPAYAIAVAHNHPSGDPTPSPQDREVTQRLAGACRAVGIALADHLVVADPGIYRSFAAEGLLGYGGPSY